MKKKVLHSSVFLLYILLLSGCTLGGKGGSSSSAETNPEKWGKIPFAGNQLYAVAYLGYQQVTDLDFYVEQYLDGDQIPTHYLSSGEYYLVIPRYTGMTLQLYQNDIETSEPILRFEDPDGQPFLLQCNASDIFADAVIRLSYAGKETEFSPFISLKDGSIEIGPDGLDLTKTER